jgi:hypothetical protein
MGNAHDDVPELCEQGALKGFCKEICNDNAGWAVYKVYLSACDPILNEEVSDVDVSGPLPS